MKTDILIVDDDEDLRVVLAELLEEDGYTVASAEHGKAALEWLRANGPPGLVLLDLMMPVMSGEAFLQATHAQAYPVFLLTASGDRPSPATAQQVKRIFRKPLDLQELEEAIKQQLGAH